MKIKPLPGIIHIKLEEAQAGGLYTGGRKSSAEVAYVIEIGDDVKVVKKGDKIHVKSWGIDHVTENNELICYVAIATNAILAVIK